jgi:hypothetical protein
MPWCLPVKKRHFSETKDQSFYLFYFLWNFLSFIYPLQRTGIVLVKLIHLVWRILMGVYVHPLKKSSTTWHIYMFELCIGIKLIDWSYLRATLCASVHKNTVLYLARTWGQLERWNVSNKLVNTIMHFPFFLYNKAWDCLFYLLRSFYYILSRQNRYKSVLLRNNSTQMLLMGSLPKGGI